MDTTRRRIHDAGMRALKRLRQARWRRPRSLAVAASGLAVLLLASPVLAASFSVVQGGFYLQNLADPADVSTVQIQATETESSLLRPPGSPFVTATTNLAWVPSVPYSTSWPPASCPAATCISIGGRAAAGVSADVPNAYARASIAQSATAVFQDILGAGFNIAYGFMVTAQADTSGGGPLDRSNVLARYYLLGEWQLRSPTGSLIGKGTFIDEADSYDCVANVTVAGNCFYRKFVDGPSGVLNVNGSENDLLYVTVSQGYLVAAPEPSTLVTLAAGLAALGFALRVRRA